MNCLKIPSLPLAGNSFLLFLLLFLAICATLPVHGQNAGKDKPHPDLPYYEIPAYPETFTAGNVAARMIDGLGYRYYWATEGLREEDLKFRPGKEARTSLETLEHIYELSQIIVNCTNKLPNITGADRPAPAFAEMRKQTLENLKSASDRLKTTSDKEMNDLKIIFKRDNSSKEFPFWNQLNGPIADVLWHTGQVVSFRRSSGNPFNEKANVFTGSTKE